MSRIILPPAAIEYPSGDGKPMAENGAQLAAILYGIGALRREEVAARRAAEARIAELEALLRGQGR